MNPSNNNNATLDYANFWDFDGEYDNDSEFVVACRLIVSAHVSALAAAISLGESSAKTNNHHFPTAVDPPNRNDNFLASIIGDVTPAAAAVAGMSLDMESPMIETPFLDPSTGTPFTPATSFTPCLNNFQDTPFMGSCNVASSSKDDIQVASYLRFDDASSWMSPAITFTADPAQLMKNSHEQQAVTMSSSTEEDTNALFPPLPSDNDQAVDLPSCAVPDALDDFSQHFDAFDASMFQDDNNNLTLEDLFGFNAIESSVAAPTTTANNTITLVHPEPTQALALPTTTVTNSKKRKQSLDNVIINEAPVKRKRLLTEDTAEGKRFECPVCKSKFSRRYNLGTHVKTHDKNRQKSFSCYLCPKAFDRKHDCDRHISTVHHGERSFSCAECPSTFSRKDALTRHMMQKHEKDDVA
ncbi:hypothetical protein EC973_001775 [Apophysomyces ossiformis]|uniref:C2H2-type domain-containing protein n=1 Tax=Apophysomyces ossiformis TaxID=679940 RepID=A0A8H7BJ72_9FUNG|nr:hypothetical protein EC973_001775 [Apophysomyces ossiformis]